MPSKINEKRKSIIYIPKHSTQQIKIIIHSNQLGYLSGIRNKPNALVRQGYQAQYPQMYACRTEAIPSKPLLNVVKKMAIKYLLISLCLLIGFY